jgi:hypothetical protein
MPANDFLRRDVLLLALALVLALGGCGKPSPPPVTDAEVVVLLNGEPLSSALVQFVPMLEHYGAEMNSQGITDNKGRAQLVCAQKQQPGAVVGKHRVLVRDAPGPAGTRGPSATAQQKMADYLASLKNRPIPPEYNDLARTPLSVDVTAGQKTYKLTLKRGS